MFSGHTMAIGVRLGLAAAALSMLGALIVVPGADAAKREQNHLDASGSPLVPNRFGFNDDAHRLLSQLQRMKRAGVDTVRFPVPEYPTPAADKAYRRLRNAGIHPILVLGGWSGAPVADPDAYAQRCAAMARRYPNATLALWNEPNLGGHNTAPDPDQTPEAIAAMVTAAAEAIREVSPDHHILGPSVGPIKGWESYFEPLYRAIPRGLVDVGMNLYPRPNIPNPQLKRWYRMGANFGRVHVTEYDPAWMGGERTPEKVRDGIALLTGLGAHTVLLNSTHDQLDEWRAVLRAESEGP